MSEVIMLPAKATIQDRILAALATGRELELTEEELTMAAADPALMERVQAIWANRLRIRMMTDGAAALFKILTDPKAKNKDKLEVFELLMASSSLTPPSGVPAKKGRGSKNNPYDEAMEKRSAGMAGRPSSD